MNQYYVVEVWFSKQWNVQTLLYQISRKKPLVYKGLKKMTSYSVGLEVQFLVLLNFYYNVQTNITKTQMSSDAKACLSFFASASWSLHWSPIWYISHDFMSRSDITPCIKIDKPQVNIRFLW